MTSLGQGSNEATDRTVPVLAEAPAATGLPRVATRVSTGRDGPQASLDRAAGTNQEIEPGKPNNRGEPSVPGLADWLLAAVAVLPAAAGSAARVRQRWTPE